MYLTETFYFVFLSHKNRNEFDGKVMLISVHLQHFLNLFLTTQSLVTCY